MSIIPRSTPQGYLKCIDTIYTTDVDINVDKMYWAGR